MSVTGPFIINAFFKVGFLPVSVGEFYVFVGLATTAHKPDGEMEAYSFGVH